MALNHIRCSTLLMCGLLLLIFTGCGASRGRARSNESREPRLKDGMCPAAEMVNRVSNTVCDDVECELDVDCEGSRKCCRNTCGGKSCVFPIETYTENEATSQPVISEVDVQSRLLSVNEGDTAVLYCNATSRVPTSYGWLRVQPGPSVPIIEVFRPGSTSGNKRVSDDGREMTVIGARVQDTASYACVAASLLGYVTKSYQLYVHASEGTDRDASNSQEMPGVTFNPRFNDDQTAPTRGVEEAAPPQLAAGEPQNWPQFLEQYLPEISQRITTTAMPMQRPNFLSTTASPGIAADSSLHEDLGSNSVCQQPRDKGTCSREEQRWFFNTSKGKCEPFTYSGCNGNLNNFRSFDECNRTCPNLSENPCEQPIFTGPCRARFMRWGYDSSRGECVKFVYGGCRENGNNFQTRSQCVSKCIQTDLSYYTLNQADARTSECRCSKPRLKNCFCSAEFAIEGTVIQKHNSERGDILVVEVANIFKQGTLSLRKANSMINNVTIIRDMSKVGQPCQCHTLEANSQPYIIMGSVNTRGDAEIDSNSYVSEATQRRANKLETTNQRSHFCKSATKSKLTKRNGMRTRGDSESRS